MLLICYNVGIKGVCHGIDICIYIPIIVILNCKHIHVLFGNLHIGCMVVVLLVIV